MATPLTVLAQSNRGGSGTSPDAAVPDVEVAGLTVDLAMTATNRRNAGRVVTWSVEASADNWQTAEAVQGPNTWQGGLIADKRTGATIDAPSAVTFHSDQVAALRGRRVRARYSVPSAFSWGLTITVLP